MKVLSLVPTYFKWRNKILRNDKEYFRRPTKRNHTNGVNVTMNESCSTNSWRRSFKEDLKKKNPLTEGKMCWNSENNET